MSILRNLLGGGSANPPVAAQATKAVITPADHKQFGLENFGNTCYINAVFQALYFCGPFRESVISMPDASNISTQPPTPVPAVAATSSIQSSKSTWNPRSSVKRRDSSANDPADSAATAPPAAPVIPTEPPSLFSALRSLFIHIAQNTQDSGKVPPTAFVKKIKDDNEAFRNNNHQDAHELFNFLLNKVVEDLEAQEKTRQAKLLSSASSNSSIHRESNRTFIHELFEGVLTSETRCLTCETVSSRDESFLDLSIDIEPNSSVTSCLRQFSASEMLCQRNKFSCDSCSGLQEAERRMKVKKLPSILALHLKRFKYQEDVQRFIKLAYRVAFPLELRLFNTVDDAENADRLYELFAIVVHIGGGPHHGHYTTIVRSRGSWVVFDDDTVESIKESDIAKYFGDSNMGAGYVLFYQAADLERSAAGVPGQAPKPAETSTEAQGVMFPVSEQTEALSTNPSPHPSVHLHSPETPIAPDSSPVKTPESSSLQPPVKREAKTSILTNGASSQLLGLSPVSAGTSDDHKRNWFGVGRSKSTKKRTKETPAPLLDPPPAPFHTRARTTGTVSEHEHYDPYRETADSFNPMGVPGHKSPSLTNGTQTSVASTSDGDPLDAKRRTSSSSESRPSTALTASSQLANSQTRETSTAQLQPSPTTEASPQEPAHTPVKKASRKMSLTAMPSRLTGFIGRKERDKDHG